MAEDAPSNSVRWFGWLEKAGASLISKWQRRLFVITNDSIEYWEPPAKAAAKTEPALVLNQYFGGGYTEDVLAGRRFTLKGKLAVDETAEVVSRTVGKAFHIRLDMGKRVYHCRTQSAHLREEFIQAVRSLREIRTRQLEEARKAAEQEEQEKDKKSEEEPLKEAEDKADELEEIATARRQLQIDLAAAEEEKQKSGSARSSAHPQSVRLRTPTSSVGSSPRVRAVAAQGSIKWEGWLLKSGNTEATANVFEWRYFILRAVALASGNTQSQLEYWAPPDDFFDSQEALEAQDLDRPLSSLVSELRFTTKGAIPVARIERVVLAKGGRSALCVLTAKSVYRFKAADRQTVNSLAAALVDKDSTATPTATTPTLASIFPPMEMQLQVEAAKAIDAETNSERAKADMGHAPATQWILRMWPEAIEGLTDAKGKDCYLQLTFQDQVVTTPRCSSAHRTAWLPRPELEFKIAAPAMGAVALSLLDADAFWNDVVLGCGSLELAALKQGDFIEVPIQFATTTAADDDGAKIAVKLFASLQPAADANQLRVDQVYEYEQRSTTKGWVPMQAAETAHFIDCTTGRAAATLAEAAAGGGALEPELSEWQAWSLLPVEGDPEAQGWMYAMSSESDEWLPEATEQALYRRRVWLRIAKHAGLAC